MKKWLFLFGFLPFLVACTLTADQEASLNSSVSRYIQARNECQVVGLVGFTHPELVKDFKSQGDSVFQQKFDCKDNPDYFNLIQNPTLRSTVKEGKTIHVLYDFDEYNQEDDVLSRRAFELVAISDNDGENWFFMPWKNYADKSQCKNLKRLIVK